MAESIFHVEGSTSTLLGILNQFHGATDLTYQTILGSTINHKRNIIPLIEPPSLPLLRYFGIGINGFYNTDDANGRAPHQPLPTNMDLYEPIPFRCVPIENDLTPEERVNYRLREVKRINGNNYCLYWLKLITYDPNTVSIIQKTPSGAEEVFSIADSNSIDSRLNPIPPALSVGGLPPLSQNRLIVRATGNCLVTGAEVAEAVNLLYEGNYTKALISEMGFYTGCEIYVRNSEGIETAVLVNNNEPVPVISGVSAPTGATGRESAYTQLSKHRCFIGVDMSNIESTMTPTISFEAGGVINL